MALSRNPRWSLFACGLAFLLSLSTAPALASDQDRRTLSPGAPSGDAREAGPSPTAFPMKLVSGATNAIVISGGAFSAHVAVTARGRTREVAADSVAVVNPQTVFATISLPTAMTGSVDLVVHPFDGGQDAVIQGLEASSEQVGCWDMEHNRIVPPVDRTATAAFALPLGLYGSELNCPYPINSCSLTDTVSTLPPPTGCAGPAAFDGRGGYVFYFFDPNTGEVIGPNCPVVMKVEPLDNSGGHCHTNIARPNAEPNYIIGDTGSDGLQFAVVFTWPQVGGQFTAKFWSTQSGCPQYNDSTTIRYVFCLGSGSLFDPGHAILTNDGTGYALIGGAATSPAHPDNHIGVPAMFDSLLSLGVAWAAQFPSGPALGFNDMSLVWGGVFDFRDKNWVSPKHCGHRAGMEADVRSTNLTLTQQRWFTRLARQRKFVVRPEGDPPHFHLKYFGPGTYRGPGAPSIP